VCANTVGGPKSEQNSARRATLAAIYQRSPLPRHVLANIEADRFAHPGLPMSIEHP
jgi:hypothetical protein